MARKPNYQFERRERDRIKAEKKAARAKAKAERAEKAREGESAVNAEADDARAED